MSLPAECLHPDEWPLGGGSSYWIYGRHTCRSPQGYDHFDA